MVNTELLERTMQHIEDNPKLHNQRVWAEETGCGTAACLAGRACALSGIELQPGWVQIWTGFMHANVQGAALIGGKLVSAGETAMELLGISAEDAILLFSPGNTIPQLKLMVKDLLNGEHLRARE